MMHPGHLPSPPGAATWIRWWTFDPLVIAGLATASIVYAVGVRRLYRVAAAGRRALMYRTIAYDAGILVCALALLSPLDHASDVLFSAHMAQHELLMVVAAPLIALARPMAPMLWALPRRWRVRAGRTLQRPGPVRAWHVLTSPVLALVLHALVRWLWHLPIFFDAALADERIHAVQHLSFFLTAVLFWWALIHGRYGRVGYGAGVAFVFLTVIHSGLLAAILAFADHPLYAPHAAASAAWGVDALVDQERAGLLMWIPVGIIMMAIGLAIFAAWIGQASRRAYLATGKP
jgi:putative membrane protein